MSCGEQENLTALLDGELDAGQAERLRAHVEGCRSCREALELLKLSYDALEHVEPFEVPRGFASRVKARARKRSLRPVLVAAAALLIASLLFFRVGLRRFVGAPSQDDGVTPIVDIADLTAEERAVVENMEILENYEILEDLELLAQFDTLLEFEQFPEIEAI